MPEYSITIAGETATAANAAELAVALDVLHGRHDREVLAQLGPNLVHILREPRGLCTVAKALTPDLQLFLLNQLGERLTEVIRQANVLRDLLSSLSDPRVELRLLELLGSEGLKAVIHAPEDLAGVLEWVYGRCDDLVISLLDGPFLRHLLQTGHEISLVLRALNAASQQVFVEKFGWPHLVSRAQNSHDFGHLLAALSPELGLRLVSTFTRESLLATVGGPRRLRELAPLLDDTKMAAVNRLLGRTDAE